MKIVENSPLDTTVLGRLITDPEDLFLVYPRARFPVDPDEWRNLLGREGNVPFLVYEEERLIGHAALVKMEDEGVYKVSFLYIIPGLRDRGRGRSLMALLESYARQRLKARRLVLRVRSYNPRGISCYEKAGYVEYFREGTLVEMGKDIR